MMKSTAAVVDGKLMLSLPDAYTPVVWQMDLQEASSSALEVKKDEGSDRFVLCLKKEGGDVTEIASYEERENAVKALLAISGSLQNAHGKIRTVQNISSAPAQAMPIGQMPVMNGANQNESGGKAGAILAVLMVVILVVAVVSLGRTDENGVTSSTSQETSRPSSSTGLPMSADDFLSSR